MILAPVKLSVQETENGVPISIDPGTEFELEWRANRSRQSPKGQGGDHRELAGGVMNIDLIMLLNMEAPQGLVGGIGCLGHGGGTYFLVWR